MRLRANLPRQTASRETNESVDHWEEEECQRERKTETRKDLGTVHWHHPPADRQLTVDWSCVVCLGVYYWSLNVLLLMKMMMMLMLSPSASDKDHARIRQAARLWMATEVSQRRR